MLLVSLSFRMCIFDFLLCFSPCSRIRHCDHSRIFPSTCLTNELQSTPITRESPLTLLIRFFNFVWDNLIILELVFIYGIPLKLIVSHIDWDGSEQQGERISFFL